MDWICEVWNRGFLWIRETVCSLNKEEAYWIIHIYIFLNLNSNFKKIKSKISQIHVQKHSGHCYGSLNNRAFRVTCGLFTHSSTCVLHSGAHHCTAGLKNQSLHMKQMYSQAEMKSERQKEKVYLVLTLSVVCWIMEPWEIFAVFLWFGDTEMMVCVVSSRNNL